MTRMATALITVAVTMLATPVPAQPQMTPEQVERMLEPLRPTAEHQELAALAGRWRQDVTFEMGGPPMKATGIVTNRMILGGRFLVSEGTSNNPSGVGDPTIEFMSIYGFDRRTLDFTIIAFDTMGTYYVTAAGKKAPEGAVVMAGETLEHEAASATMRKYDMVLKVIDADTYLSQIIFKVAGRPDQTIVSITHTRVK